MLKDLKVNLGIHLNLTKQPYVSLVKMQQIKVIS